MVIDYKPQDFPDGEITSPVGTYVIVITDLTGLKDYRIKQRNLLKPIVVTVTVSATPAINVDNGTLFRITSQNAAITSMTTNLTGTPYDGQEIDIEVLDDGTARAITWGASFASGPGTLPTTTVLSKWLYVKLRYSSSRSKWMCMAVGNEQ